VRRWRGWDLADHGWRWRRLDLADTGGVGAVVPDERRLPLEPGAPRAQEVVAALGEPRRWRLMDDGRGCL